MSEQYKYKYIDTDFKYTYAKTGVLKNLANITDEDDLLFFESTFVTKRQIQLNDKPLKINGIDTLFEIHKHLFQDVYEWAGKQRVTEISKKGKQFFSLSHFDTALKYIDSLISEYQAIDAGNTDKISKKLAQILDNVNYLHPFREGNGRTQREFVRTLALEKGYILNLNPPNDIEVYEQYMNGTINGNIEILKNLIEKNLIKNMK